MIILIQCWHCVLHVGQCGRAEELQSSTQYTPDHMCPDIKANDRSMWVPVKQNTANVWPSKCSTEEALSQQIIPGH